MLRARLSNGHFILGVDAENVRRLKAGMPIVANLAQQGGTDTVIIMYGETLEQIAFELERATGQELPVAEDHR